MIDEGLTLAEISYFVAAKMFPLSPTSEETSSSLFVSQVDIAQKDYLKFLNRSLNQGQFSATHLISRRTFTMGIDAAEDDSSEWFVDPPNASVACRLLGEAFPVGQSIFTELCDHHLEPLRRLRRLVTECGGTYKKVGSKWRFTRFEDLKKRELAEGRKRCSDKTIRADLVEAAESSEAQKRTGSMVPGLAQPKRALATPFAGL